VLKIDYEKAYDRVNWDFLEKMIISRGFDPKWVNWVMRLVKNGSIAVRLNDINSVFFKLGKVLRQGDPLSPLILWLMCSLGC
jgi:hypothetical protein